MKASGRSKERGIVFIRNIRQSAVSILPICNGHAVNCIQLLLGYKILCVSRPAQRKFKIILPKINVSRANTLSTP